MTHRILTVFALAAASFSAVSCKDNPELVRQRDEQAAEIKRLEGELAVLDEKTKDVPPDRTKDLAEAKARATVQAAEIERLEKEVATMEARKRELDATFSAYRVKYQVKPL
ncbi:hypothetical protein [Luteolibacter sp. LG18]|uniref:hypothetical protein n=1 Tax=Luteolibacter sp. LG18 TaxID=2819286 RepID=UPI002B2D3193|nr:hypothetical protein llg_19140 [Luteolibacter sp. LG18]